MKIIKTEKKNRKVRLDILLGIILLSVVGGILTQTNIERTVEKQCQEIVQPPTQSFFKEIPKEIPEEPAKEAPSKYAIALKKYFGSLATIQSAIPEIKWIEYNDNSVYIGFNPIPADVRTILGGHAFVGWQAIDFGCHIYAYDASKYDSQEFGKFFAGATCRYGKTKHY